MSSRSVNKIILVGNVGREPDVQQTSAGTTVVHVSLATNRRPDAEGKQLTDWHRLTIWGKLGEYAAKHVEQGDRIYIEGEVQYGSYERNSVTIPTVEVVVRELVLLPSGRSGRDDEEDAPTRTGERKHGTEARR